jgi:hypothetical protein
VIFGDSVVDLACVLTRDSLDCPDEMFSFYRENGVDSIAFNIEEVTGENRRSSIVIDSLTQYRAFLKRFHALNVEAGSPLDSSARE